jgi:rhodanese-related sulfurtransferase
MQVVKRIVLIGTAAMICGFSINQFLAEGLNWRLLRLTLNPQGRQQAWQPISADSAFFMHSTGDAVFVDIREQEAYEVDHIPGALSIPFHQFFKDPAPLLSGDPRRPHILYCQEAFCRRDRLMVQALQSHGFTSVYFIRNGYLKWLEYGFPVDSESK